MHCEFVLRSGLFALSRGNVCQRALPGRHIRRPNHASPLKGIDDRGLHQRGLDLRNLGTKAACILFPFKVLSALASGTPSVNESVSEISAAGNALANLTVAWDVERPKNMADPTAGTARFVDCAWMSFPCCFRVQYGTGSVRPLLKLESLDHQISVSKFPFFQGKMRTEAGHTFFLFVNSGGQQISETDPEPSLAESPLQFAELNPCSVFWWVSQQSGPPEKFASSKSLDELVIEIPAPAKRCTLRKLADKTWFVERVESFSDSGSPLQVIDFSEPLALEGIPVSIGTNRRMTFLQSLKFGGTSTPLAPQTATLVAVSTRPMASDYFAPPQGFKKTEIRNPSVTGSTPLDKFRATGVKPPTLVDNPANNRGVRWGALAGIAAFLGAAAVLVVGWRIRSRAA